MLDSFLTFINQQKWDLAKHKTLLAVSGGVDSVVMLHLFYKAGFEAYVAHCNFGLRDVESDEDEAFVRDLAQAYNFPIYVKLFATKEYAKSSSVSTQMAARDLRYEWFERLVSENGFQWIATAHHANDSIETTLLNLTRGTGPAGVYGIPIMNGTVIRPMLFASREEIEVYLKENNLSWREDRSNASVDYKRNLIRHKVIPLLKEMNPGLENTFKTTSERLRASDSLLEDFMATWKEGVVTQQGDEIRVNLDKLQSVTEPVYRLWFILRNYGFSYLQAQQIGSNIDGLSGKIFFSQSHQLLKDRHFFIVKRIEPDGERSALEIDNEYGSYFFGRCSLNLQVLSKTDDFQYEKTSNLVYLDRRLLVFPLVLREWQVGDTFCPFGMAGRHKKISDLLIDLKLSVFQKQKQKVLTNGNGVIIWVVGIRPDERFRVTDKTETILKITFQEGLNEEVCNGEEFN